MNITLNREAGRRLAPVTLLAAIIEKWESEQERLEIAADNAPNRLEAAAYRGTSEKIKDFLHDLKRLAANEKDKLRTQRKRA